MAKLKVSTVSRDAEQEEPLYTSVRANRYKHLENRGVLCGQMMSSSIFPGPVVQLQDLYPIPNLAYVHQETGPRTGIQPYCFHEKILETFK